ncbi:conserved hypothetical protein [Burkholderia pseudomallei 1106b]|uniref:Uncharacterized protein n=1 Tax=Burkholderia pseudomallei (strain 1106a) TaxID=357348 RepID=A3P5H2_BURP0|nr:conserved hypothetical protein [Burkholderia pseudomallei 1106a]EEC38646.1 conserved hypothetical protein [Burkholderia pseudomallei 576]EES21454.1 conserved hypothetical protein [Burkholderia pseudomallei 1106b]
MPHADNLFSPRRYRTARCACHAQARGHAHTRRPPPRAGMRSHMDCADA